MNASAELREIIEETCPMMSDRDHTIWDDLCDLIKWDTVTAENLEIIAQNWDWDFSRDDETILDLIQDLALRMRQEERTREAA